MKWCLVFSISFLLITFKIQACQDPEDKAVMRCAVAKILQAETEKRGVNKIIVRTLSCELPTIAGDGRGGRPILDVERLQKDEHPRAFDFNHPGRKLVGRADSPKGSPRDPSKLQQSMTSTSEDELSGEETPPILITQRRATFSE
jgi:hypothetical protein